MLEVRLSRLEVRLNLLTLKSFLELLCPVGQFSVLGIYRAPGTRLRALSLKLKALEKKVVEISRFELLTPCLQGRCSPS